MKHTTLLVLLLLLLSATTFAQSPEKEITIKKMLGEYQLFQGGQRISFGNACKVMQTNPEAYKIIKKAQTPRSFAMILGMAGGAMVGWQLGATLAGGDANWAVAGIGAGLIVVTFPIIKSYNKKVKQAVEIYNESYKKTSFWQRSELKLGFTGNGVALALRF